MRKPFAEFPRPFRVARRLFSAARTTFRAVPRPFEARKMRFSYPFDAVWPIAVRLFILIGAFFIYYRCLLSNYLLSLQIITDI